MHSYKLLKRYVFNFNIDKYTFLILIFEIKSIYDISKSLLYILYVDAKNLLRLCCLSVLLITNLFD